MGETSERELEQMRVNIAQRERRRQEHRERRLKIARRDFTRIIDHIATKYSTIRIYQWESLIDGRHFSDRSDTEFAIEGITDAAEFFAILADAAEMTDLPMDIVQLETIHPVYAASIRERGRVVYER